MRKQTRSTLAGAIALCAVSPAFAGGATVGDPAANPAIPFPGHSVNTLLDGSETERDIAFSELTVAPQSMGAPPHSHSREDEFFYVLEGEINFLDGEETITASQGQVVALKRGHLHGFWNESDAPARLLLMVSPSAFASFFDAVAMELRARDAKTAPEVGGTIAEVAARYGVTIHPDKMPPAMKALAPR